MNSLQIINNNINEHFNTLKLINKDIKNKILLGSKIISKSLKKEALSFGVVTEEALQIVYIYRLS